MANRYFTYEELSEKISTEDYIFKPAGTLGRHHLEVRPHFKGVKARGVENNPKFNPDCVSRVLNYSEQEHHQLSEWVIVEPGGSLGYNCGHVWAIRPRKKMTPLQNLRAEFKLSKDRVFILPASEVEKIELEGLQSVPVTRHTNTNRFWGSGETPGYWGENCAFTIYHSFHGGTDQRRSIGRVFIFSENTEAGIKECFDALKSYYNTSHTNIKHPANGLFGAP